jgi:hypothetical protein
MSATIDGTAQRLGVILRIAGRGENNLPTAVARRLGTIHHSPTMRMPACRLFHAPTVIFGVSQRGSNVLVGVQCNRPD